MIGSLLLSNMVLVLASGCLECCTLYRSNFIAHSLTARFVAALKHFYFLSFIPSDIDRVLKATVQISV